ncbi:tartrate dehydrogenase [Brevibacillus humidisoli]|uniref:tartrate dehydrogenase n=1 Tax=Brevibacillus humidisoli TaxID=2895522 RepID=UPI001E57CC1C|nr:tartrate dehydrogenase [Brevibacillus humidisoli]UFJ42372.1 tartrate dehydrogenase [Brevibacillus humidisoli]
MNHYAIAVIAGDGIGPEVMREGLRVLRTIEQLHGGIRFETSAFDWNCLHYQRHGVMMPKDGLEILQGFDAILLGAIGSPDVPDHISVWELILPIRRTFQQYVNLRPIKLLRGLVSPLREKGHDQLDFVVVRENTEGEYADMGGRLHSGTPYELAIQNSVFTRYGIERVVRYAYSLAATTGKRRLAAATKSNGINHSMPFWDEVVHELSRDYPQIETSLFHIDAMAAYFVNRPEQFDVVVASNLFGDILTDLGAAVVGGLGLAPSGNINPEKRYPSMFEPIHGSAPDIAGIGIANPIGQIWSISMMLDHLGHRELGRYLLDSIEAVLLQGQVRTPDIGGTATTQEMGEAVVRQLLTDA